MHGAGGTRSWSKGSTGLRRTARLRVARGTWEICTHEHRAPASIHSGMPAEMCGPVLQLHEQFVGPPVGHAWQKKCKQSPPPRRPSGRIVVI